MKTMKTCKTGCGKMKSGGKVAAVKKMQEGGSTIKELQKKDGRNILGNKSAKIGIGTALSGMAGIAGKAIKDAIKAKKEKRRMKMEEVKNNNATKSEATQEKKQMGGVKKKYQDGGSMITGMPKYSNNPRTDAGRMLQKGGSFAPNRAVQASCKGGMVRDENGRCVTARKMQKGGFPDLNKDGKVTKADILKGRGVIKKLGGAKKR
jgi:hypothetical protein